MINSDFVQKYGLTLSLILIASYFGTQIKEKLHVDRKEEEDHELIRKYILNDSPLYGYNKPKLWIHSIYEINSRNWKSFQSRNTEELNQPYLNYTIKSIINKCSDHFHICLIDDKSFNKLIPGYSKNISNMPDPLKTQYRELAMLELIYLYGGIIVPNSFLCMKNLNELYQKLHSLKKPYVFEQRNKYCDMKLKKKPDYVPNIEMIGSRKNCPIIYSIIRLLKMDLDKGHITQENDFTGKTSNILMQFINTGDMAIVDGTTIGIKDTSNKAIDIEDLFSYNKEIHFSDEMYGINLPKEDILKRSKFNWLAALNEEDTMKANINLVRYIKVSQVSDYLDNKKVISTYF